jgi:DNA-binding transcriptional LysR family regulator
MDRFHEMQVFQAVAEAGGFAAAARRLNTSAASVTRAVAGLEARIGALLFRRSTRNVTLTDAGQRYLDDSRRILAELDEADAAAAGQHASARGLLVVTAPVLFGEQYVMPIVAEHLAAHPDLQVQCVLLDRVVSMQEEGIDVGIRIGELPDSTLNAVPVGHVRRVVCASPALLARVGRPADPEALAALPVVLAAAVTRTHEWRFGAGDSHIAVRVHPRLVVNANGAAIEAARRGVGFVRLLSYQVAADIRRGALEIVLPSHEPAPLPVHVVYRDGRRANARVRGFVDACVGSLRAALADAGTAPAEALIARLHGIH